ncbi:MAG: 3-aminobutyryl-CoA ammonia lyase [Deltaproteobacteria bacterium]|nr:3-aminobutyryl-CoA ammonia lyase [Deltaproteobacteria bacterium]
MKKFPSVTLRIRISDADAHYAGGLASGAKVMELFGDVATELLIRYDGDEGLFRAYRDVEFLAPVRAGDFIEATGQILRIGKTSREMAFAATKVIERAKSGSRARVLKKPVLVARARGTCVVKR